MGRALFSDMGSHGLVDGDPLVHPLFPKIYPKPEPSEMAERAAGRCTRTREGMTRLASRMFESAGEMVSWCVRAAANPHPLLLRAPHLARDLSRRFRLFLSRLFLSSLPTFPCFHRPDTSCSRARRARHRA
uniref:Uncharacterized protein n=2 Tax=Chrysotila carterae TaxID=13221 RepID=A0A7S4F7B8_CHRCT